MNRPPTERRRRAALAALASVLLLLTTAACLQIGGDGRRAAALAAAQAAGLEPRLIAAEAFDLSARLRRAGTPGGRLAVFIEGDGNAWETRFRPSDDPTPRRPVALELATRSGLPAVAYLARPCQEVAEDRRRNCHVAYWTSHRFAPDVIAATGQALDRLKAAAGADSLLLVGFSGGAAVALLVASERADVAGVVTVSGVLDHRAWTAFHAVTPLAGSLDPRDRLDRLAAVPQVHVVGSDDAVVPPALVRDFADRIVALGGTAPVVEVADADHNCCWATRWPELEARALRLLGRPA